MVESDTATNTSLKALTCSRHAHQLGKAVTHARVFLISTKVSWTTLWPMPTTPNFSWADSQTWQNSDLCPGAPCFGHTVELHQAVTQTQTGPYLISGRWLSSTKLWPMSKETLTQIWVWTQAWQSSYPPQDRPLPCFALKLDKAFKPRLAQGWWTWQSSGPCPDRPCFWHAGEPDRAVTHAQTDPDLAEGRQLSLKKQWSMPRQDLTLLRAEVKLDKAVIHT